MREPPQPCMASTRKRINSPLQRIDLGDVDGASIAEQRDQDRQADRGFRRGHCQDEEHEHLPGRVAELTRKCNEVDVDGEQHQLDRHQEDDHVLAVEHDARNADAEQRGAERKVVTQSDAFTEQSHGCTSSPVAGACGFTASILTMRMRSTARTRACSDGFWCRAPGRRRSVSMTAAITAIVRITAATSNGSMKSVNSARANQVVLGTSATLSAKGVALAALTPIRVSISASMTTATMSPSGRYRTKPSRNGATSRSSIITTKRNRTITAPT